MEALCIVVISSMVVMILGQMSQCIYKKYHQKDRMMILAEFDPNMEMGPLI